MSGRKSVGPGGDRRTVTVTFGYEDGLRTLVAGTLRLALILADARWGRWQTIESISTPDTIFADVTGLTKARNQPGVNRGGRPDVEAKLLRIGYVPSPGEVATVRFYRSELPATYRHTKRPTKVTPTVFDDDEHGKRAERAQ